MKIVLTLFHFAIGVALLSAVSCQKRGDFEVSCRIEKITEYYHFYPEDPFQITTATFSYNAWGDPSTIMMNPVSTGKPNYYFQYDHKRRLIAFIGKYSESTIDFFTRYRYNSQQFIELDTTYYSGTNINDPASFYQWSTSKYSYDAQGRVIKVEIKYNLDPSQAWYTTTYSYDANGNKIRAGVTYDNKTNFMRTNLVFAFINRDYSKNNYTAAESYNARGLPTSFSPEWRTHHTPFFMNLRATKIDYSCDSHYTKYE